jgi:hypothetical protein
MIRKESSCATTTSVLRSYLGLSNEVMHKAVMQAINKKRDFASSENQGGTVSPSETPHKPS